MKHYPFSGWRKVSFLIVFILLIFPLALQAQDNPPSGTPIEITSPVSQINGSTLTVAGFSIDTTGMTLDPAIVVGVPVKVIGQLLPNNVIAPQSIIIVVIVPPEATPSPTAEGTPEATAVPTSEATPETTATPSPTSNPIIVVEGPITNIVNNIITVYNFNITVAPNHPILNIIQIGDVVHIEGTPDSNGTIVATVVSNIVTNTTVRTGGSGATVGLDGPVDAINGNTVTVNGIPVEFAPDDPILKNLQVGNFVSVQGNFTGSGNTIILVVINVTVYNNITIINNNCWFDPGPDPAMGMADPGMGMEDPGMGMGDPGMGAPPPPPGMGMEDPGMGMGHWHCDGMGMGG